MIETVESFIKNYKISGRILAAFSGGYDSMCLLHILHKLNKDVIAIHLNHNWRGEESLQEAEVCKNFAKQLGIEFYYETLPDNTPKTETAAREARYKFFEKCAKKYGTKFVLTAHNKDDNAETVLYRIIKGTGVSGLKGIAEHRGIYYRPLLKISREDIETYCCENELFPNSDSSNSNIKYKRNYLRHKIIPLMEEINPNVKDAINSLSELAIEQELILKNKLSADILNVSEIEQKYTVHRFCIENNLNYNRKKIENIVNFINENKNSKTGRTISLTNNLWLFVNCNKAEIIEKSDFSDNEIDINCEGQYKFETGIFEIKKFEGEVTNFPADKDNEAFVHIDKIGFKLRHRREGDFIQPLGCRGHQKLKKYLNEKKVPKHEKNKLIFLCRDNEILWAAGLGISEKLRVADRPTHMIKYIEGKIL